MTELTVADLGGCRAGSVPPPTPFGRRTDSITYGTPDTRQR